MSAVDMTRREFALAVLGGPTTVIDLAGRRLIVDPTFDPPGPHAHLTKTVAPAVSAAALGAVDAVLISHDEHADNLDVEGRRFASEAPLIVTHPGAATRLGGSAHGLSPWEAIELPSADGLPGLSIRAVPAVHGPADGERDATGNVTCEVTGFVVGGYGIPTIYVSGDNASMAVVAQIAERVGPVDVAVLFVGAARVAVRHRGRPLTLTSERAAAAAEVLGAKLVVPAHIDGWAHFTEGITDVVRAFDDAGLSGVLASAPLGEWIVPALR
jgi:L-ascorbate metabolism protein UlaG (beta-lactamase superfamily)